MLSLLPWSPGFAHCHGPIARPPSSPIRARLPPSLSLPPQQAVIRLAPEWLVNRQVMRMHQGFRSRYYRRLVRRCCYHCCVLACCVALS